MMTTRFRPIALGLLAALGVAGGSSDSFADPDRPATSSASSSASASASASSASSVSATCDQHDRDRDHELNYIYFYDENSTTMSGNMKDIERARRFKHAKEPLLWFRD